MIEPGLLPRRTSLSPSNPAPQTNTVHRKTLQSNRAWSSEEIQRLSTIVQKAAQPVEWGSAVWQAQISPHSSASFTTLLLHGIKHPVTLSPSFSHAYSERSHGHCVRHCPSIFLSMGSRKLWNFSWVGWSCGQKREGDSGTWKQIPWHGKNGVYEELSWSMGFRKTDELGNLCNSCEHELFPDVMVMLWFQIYVTQTPPYDLCWCSQIICQPSVLLMLPWRASPKCATLLWCWLHPCLFKGQEQMILSHSVLTDIRSRRRLDFFLAFSAVPN